MKQFKNEKYPFLSDKTLSTKSTMGIKLYNCLKNNGCDMSTTDSVLTYLKGKTAAQLYELSGFGPTLMRTLKTWVGRFGV